MASFSEAFRKARAAKGPGKTFTWNGSVYSTNTAEDKKNARSSSSAVTASPRPKAKAAAKTAGSSRLAAGAPQGSRNSVFTKNWERKPKPRPATGDPAARPPSVMSKSPAQPPMPAAAAAKTKAGKRGDRMRRRG